MSRSWLPKVYSGYLLNDPMAIIPWHFRNTNYMQWFHLKKNKYCHNLGVLEQETIKERNSIWLITKCKQILSVSRRHYLTVRSWSPKQLCFSCFQLQGYFTKWLSGFIWQDLVSFQQVTTSSPDFRISAQELVVWRSGVFFMHVNTYCCHHKYFLQLNNFFSLGTIPKTSIWSIWLLWHLSHPSPTKPKNNGKIVRFLLNF